MAITLGDIIKDLGEATTIVPEVVALGQAIASLFRKQPALTPEEIAALTQALAMGIHATNAATIAQLGKIP